MSKRILLLFVGVLAMGLIAAGCGDDDDGGDTADTTTSIEETTAEETTEDTESEDSGGADVPDDVDAAVQQAIDSCKQTVNAAPQLSAETVTELEDLCEEAASGDAEDAQAAAEEVCIKIAEESAPEGSVRDQAIAACEQVSP